MQTMIFMFGDTHGNFKHVARVVAEHQPRAIIFLGDIQAQRPLHEELAEVINKTDVWFIHGNHDTDSQRDYDNLFNSELAERNLHGRIVEIAGLRVAGLGGVFRGEIWYPDSPEAKPSFDNYSEYLKGSEPRQIFNAAAIRAENANQIHAKVQGKLLKHRSSIFYQEWLDLYGQHADILVTHEAPSCHPHGFKVIDELARSMRVKFAFHGHHHDRLNYQSFEKELRFSAHGVGIGGVSDQYGGMVLAGKFDR